MEYMLAFYHLKKMLPFYKNYCCIAYALPCFLALLVSLWILVCLVLILLIVSALDRHWTSAGNLLPLTGLQLLMFCLVERTWLCHVWHVHASLKNLKPKLM